MSNPLDLKEFRHYLIFVDGGTEDRFEISEPVKFDASEFVIEQDDKGYARDISYMNKEISLEFYKEFRESSETPYETLDGTIVYKLGHCLDRLLEFNKTKGFQSYVKYIIERNDLEFIPGELNFEGSETDELTYFKCKVIQETQKALAKRREDTKIDGFATEDLDGNPISPLTTTNILLKAKPVIQTSEWYVPNNRIIQRFSSDAKAWYFNGLFGVRLYAIQNTLSFIPDLYENGSNLGFIEAQDDLIDVSIVAENISFVFYTSDSDFSNIALYYRLGDEYSTSTEVLIENLGTGTEIDNAFHYENISYELSFDIIRGQKLWIYFKTNSLNFTVAYAFTSGVQTATGTSTAIDTVIKSFRYIDLAKQSLKATNGMDLLASDFEEGGEHYNLFATSGNLIRQRDDVPFYITLKDRKENLMFRNYDLQINSTDAFVLKYDKFYDNIDNGGFSLASSDKFNSTYNPRYAINTLEYEFKTYEQDRDEENTTDSVHTKTQWNINNTRVKATKQISISDIFDPFKIESIKNLAVKSTTALDSDNKIIALDCVELAPSSRGGFTASMTHNIDDDNRLQLLKDADLPSWALLGFGVGDEFIVVSDENNGTYTVFEITDSIITLTPVSALPTFTGVDLTEVDYPYTNVAYVNRTNEGFDLIENVLSPNNFGNLKYTIRRNLVDWESYISTSALYIEDNVKNTEFINNGLLVTQFNGGEVYIENADIVLNNITSPILTPKLYDVDVIAEYDTVLNLISKYENINTVGGFIRVQDTNNGIKKIYPKKLAYTWATKVLNIIGEERYEDDTVTVTRVDNTIYINEVGYDISTLPEVFYEANGDFIVLFDENNVNLINFTKYNKFIVQEGTFDNPIDLVQALIDL